MNFVCGTCGSLSLILTHPPEDLKKKTEKKVSKRKKNDRMCLSFRKKKWSKLVCAVCGFCTLRTASGPLAADSNSNYNSSYFSEVSENVARHIYHTPLAAAQTIGRVATAAAAAAVLLSTFRCAVGTFFFFFCYTFLVWCF